MHVNLLTLFTTIKVFYKFLSKMFYKKENQYKIKLYCIGILI